MTTEKLIDESHPCFAARLIEEGVKVGYSVDFMKKRIKLPSELHDWVRETTIDIAEHKRLLAESYTCGAQYGEQATIKALLDKINRGSLDYARGHEEGLKHGEQAALRRVKEAYNNFLQNNEGCTCPGGDCSGCDIIQFRNAVGLGEEEKP